MPQTSYEILHLQDVVDVASLYSLYTGRGSKNEAIKRKILGTTPAQIEWVAFRNGAFPIPIHCWPIGWTKERSLDTPSYSGCRITMTVLDGPTAVAPSLFWT